MVTDEFHPFGCELDRTLVLARDERDIAKVDERDRSTVVVTRGAVHLECTLVKDTGAREVPRSDGDGAQHVQRRGDDGAVTRLSPRVSARSAAARDAA